jgi:type I restriction enzyme S subunit
MPNNWKTYKLEQIVNSANTGLDAIRRAPIVEEDTGIKCLRIQDVSQKKVFKNWGFCKVTPENYEKFSLNEGEIIIARTGNTIGVNRYISKDLKSVFNNGLIRLRVNKEKFYPKYVYYNFRSQRFRDYIQAIAYGTSTQPNMQINSLLSFELDVPPLPEQKAIANFLSAIDDKIENNLAINKTLEDMAMALYKHWFVDFGPFQDGEFSDSELGPIPKGWEVKPFLELFELLSGGTPKTSIEDYWGGNIYWVSAKDIGSSGSIYINNTEKKITKLGLEKSSTKILPEDTVVVVARGSVGKFGMITKPMCMNQSCYGIYSKSNYSQAITYLLIDSLMKHFLNVAYGSVFDTITTSTFKNVNVLLPPKKVMDKIRNEIDVLFQNKKMNIKENQSLTQLRDTILPKLINGEVRLKEFKEQVEKVI